jgi:hypothetical protein
MKRLQKGTQNQLNAAIANAAPGCYNDDCWIGVKKVFNALDEKTKELGIDWAVESTRYHTDSEGNPCRKTYYISAGTKDARSFGVVIASAAGSVHNPFDRYDICSYFL